MVVAWANEFVCGPGHTCKARRGTPGSWRRPAGRCTTCTSFQVKHVGSSLSAAVWLSGGNPADLTLEA